MRPLRTFPARVGLFLLACLLAGCSLLRVGYANGESLVYWWLDSYVDFQEEQKPWVKSHIHAFYTWHRQTQLKDYAQLLARTQQQLQHPVAPADVLATYLEVKQRALLVVRQALPQLTDLALSLQPQQIAHLEKKFGENNERYRKDYLQGAVEDRQRYRFEKAMKQAEYWFGDFSAQQEEKIRAASDARPLNNELWLAERMQRQQNLIRILKRIQAEKPGREAAAALLNVHAATVLELATYEEHKQFFDASREGNAQLTALVINLATPAQKAHALRRLQNLIDDCNALAA